MICHNMSCIILIRLMQLHGYSFIQLSNCTIYEGYNYRKLIYTYSSKSNCVWWKTILPGRFTGHHNPGSRCCKLKKKRRNFILDKYYFTDKNYGNLQIIFIKNSPHRKKSLIHSKLKTPTSDIYRKKKMSFASN